MIARVGVIARRRLDPQVLAYVQAVGVTDGNTIAAINRLVVRMKQNGLWGGLRTVCLFFGSTETARRTNFLNLDTSTDASVRATFTGTYNFNDPTTGVSLRGGTVFFNTTTGAGLTPPLDNTRGGLNPEEQTGLHVFSCKPTTGFSSYTFTRRTTAQFLMGIRANTTTVGYTPHPFAAWFDFTAPYHGVTILNGNKPANQQILMQNGVVLQTTFREDATGGHFFPYGITANTNLDVNLIMSGNLALSTSQLTLLNTIVTDFLTETGRL